MINRVLIRMKTVQLLYSYLLVEKPFSLESQPSAPTKEKRFAYNLYLETIFLIDSLAHQIIGKNKSYPLANTRFILKTEDDEKIKSLKKKYSNGGDPFSVIIPELRESIKGSLLFKEFEKNYQQGITTENFWEDVFKAIILPNISYNNVVTTLPDYSLSGMERMKLMMEDTFKNFYATKDNIDDALKSLQMSLQKAREVYMRLLALPVELTALRLEQLENNRKKLLAGIEDLNPNMRFVENPVPAFIERDPIFQDYLEKHHLSWRAEDPELLELLLKAILQSDVYIEYMDKASVNLKDSSDFWQKAITEVILNNQDFLEYLETKSVFWNDDLEIMGSFVLKTLKRYEDEGTTDNAVLPMYKDGESGKDAKFGAELFRYVVQNKDIYRKYIEDILSKEKWSADRLAFMDVVITMTALAEIIHYPEIPLTVSINEYIEIAKSYSSAKSGQFVHGLLASLINKLKDEKIIQK